MANVVVYGLIHIVLFINTWKFTFQLSTFDIQDDLTHSSVFLADENNLLVILTCHFQKVCEKCTKHDRLEDFCKNCTALITEEDFQDWLETQALLDKHKLSVKRAHTLENK